jgi:hypothetical protein
LSLYFCEDSYSIESGKDGGKEERRESLGNARLVFRPLPEHSTCIEFNTLTMQFHESIFPYRKSRPELPLVR